MKIKREKKIIIRNQGWWHLRPKCDVGLQQKSKALANMESLTLHSSVVLTGQRVEPWITPSRCIASTEICALTPGFLL